MRGDPVTSDVVPGGTPPFDEVLRRQRMVRPPYVDAPVPDDVLRVVLDAGGRAPSAGFTQGVSFLVLRGDETRVVWEVTWPAEGGAPPEAPVVVLPLESKAAYLARYAEEDKAGAFPDEQAWPAPYWTVDCAFATMTVLLAATAYGLGAWFFAIPQRERDLLDALGVPMEWRAIGAITLGVRPADAPRQGSVLTRPKRSFDDRVRFGRW